MDIDIEMDCVKSSPMQERRKEKKKLDRDQVSWLMNALERFANATNQHVLMASRLPNAAKLAALLEIMEVLGYEFEDKAAAGNALYPFWEFNELRGLEK